MGGCPQYGITITHLFPRTLTGTTEEIRVTLARSAEAGASAHAFLTVLLRAAPGGL